MTFVYQVNPLGKHQETPPLSVQAPRSCRPFCDENPIFYIDG